MAFSAGDRVAKYELVRLLGRGGLGEVWVATDPALARQVAIKFILGTRGFDDTERARLLKEAQAAAQVAHPNIVIVHAVDVDNDPPYLVMELLAGPSLAERLKGGPLEIDEAVTLTRQVAQALDHAHGTGLVHRDIKPANLVFDRHDGLKVCDFGIVLFHNAVTQAGVTSHGFGSPHYAAPEQWAEDPVDGRADLYSLGCVLFEMLTGRPVFAGPSPTAVMARHAVTPPPRPKSLRPEVPLSLDQLVTDLLAKRPDDRPASAAEVVSRLNSVLSSRAKQDFTGAPRLPPYDAIPGPHPGATAAPPAPVPRPRPRRGVRLAVIMTACLTVAVTISLVVIRPTTSALAGTLSDPHGLEARGDFSPDGRAISIETGNAYLDVFSTATGKQTARIHVPYSGTSLSDLSFAGDGRALALTYSGESYLWNTATNKITATLTEPSGASANWGSLSPDGRTLATYATNIDESRNVVELWNTNTGRITAAFTDPGSADGGVFSPDGRTLATYGAGSTGAAALWNVTDGKVISLTDPGGEGVQGLAFSPDGHTLAVSDANGNVYLWSTTTDKITATLQSPDGMSTIDVAFTPDGRILAAADNGSHTSVWNTTTGKITATFTDPGPNSVVQGAIFSPSGTTLATFDQNGNVYLWHLPS